MSNSYAIYSQVAIFALRFEEEFRRELLQRMESNEKATGGQTKKASKTKDWDKIVKDFEEEEKKNNDTVDDLFRQIYANSSEEVRRAMNKSFQESGGTCLSTNWEDVSKRKVEISPPEGMEHKKW